MPIKATSNKQVHIYAGPSGRSQITISYSKYSPFQSKESSNSSNGPAKKEEKEAFLQYIPEFRYSCKTVVFVPTLSTNNFGVEALKRISDRKADDFPTAHDHAACV